MQERRNFSRVEFRVSALLQSDGVALKGEVKDLSLHGLYLESKEILPPGTPVEITIYLSGAAEPIVINVSGSVARLVPGGMGCVFDKMDADSFAHLRSIISYQVSDESKVMAEFAEYLVKKGNNG
ncbi:PilZ domain-containing protein [Geomonas sp.]|uniref:PilZ domain-containing protein n=1 Tax=Geomonas sp. TaxID=2651584 RepID=UPI002B472C9F|nr:PilZ domain-containing protein [Geomonas sp.]HJV35538.1 PilZ domain-containing protein [Geomonas sp.]